MMILAGILVASSSYHRAFAFQPPISPRTHTNHVASTSASLAFETAAKTILPSTLYDNLSVVKSRRMSATSLYFFGMNNNEDKSYENIKSKQQAKGKKDATTNEKDTDDDDQSFLSKYVKPSLSILKIALPSAVAGAAVTLSVLFLPLLSDYYDAFNGVSSKDFYGVPSSTGSQSSSSSSTGKAVNSVNNINQPVILFETILNDLNDAYVDDVDIQKLFETGVKAMTSSLDPYTEFESRQEAQDLEESVSGKYGGVGLVIRGSTIVADASDDEDIVLEQSDNTPSSVNEKIETPTAPVAVKDSKSGNKVTDDDDDDKIELAERKRRRQKSMEDGIRVVSAFEGKNSRCSISLCFNIMYASIALTSLGGTGGATGYAYDAGLRVGDKLLAIDDFEIKPTTAVDEVRNHLRGEPGTPVSITFLRDGVGGEKSEPQTISMQRTVVRIPDVKYFGELRVMCAALID